MYLAGHGSPKTNQCINAYRKTEMGKKRLQIMKKTNKRKTMKNKMKETVKIKTLAIWMYQRLRWKLYQKYNRAPCNYRWTEKGRQKTSCKFISVNESTEWLTWKYPEDGTCRQKRFAFKINLYVSDLWVVQTPVMENGWEVV